MPTLQQDEEYRDRLRQRIAPILQGTAEDLERNDLEEGLSFGALRSEFEGARRLFEQLATGDLGVLPTAAIIRAIEQADVTARLFNEIRIFSVVKHSSNFVNARNRLVDQIREHDLKLSTELLPVVAIVAASGAANQTRIGANVRADAENELAKLRDLADEAQHLLEASKTSVQRSGVADHSATFGAEAKSNNASAKSWLISVSWLAGLTLSLAVLNFLLLLPWTTDRTNIFGGRILSSSIGEALQYSVAKVIIFSLLVSATIWAGRNYKAHRHNSIVNTHRANALKAFEQFAVAAHDIETKNAVLLQATSSIFAPQQSGYMTGETDSGTPQIVELYRHLGGGRGSDKE